MDPLPRVHFPRHSEQVHKYCIDLEFNFEFEFTLKEKRTVVPANLVWIKEVSEDPRRIEVRYIHHVAAVTTN